jgi:hypothetical protein
VKKIDGWVSTNGRASNTTITMDALKANHSLVCGRVGDYATFIPLKNGDGFVLNEANPIPETLFISGADCFKDDVIVQTTRKEIMDLMDMTSKDDAKAIFPKVWGVIKNTDTDTVYTRGGKAWANYMQDIIIYYVCRFKLFGTPMPMIEDPRIPKLSKTKTKATVDFNK